MVSSFRSGYTGHSGWGFHPFHSGQTVILETSSPVIDTFVKVSKCRLGWIRHVHADCSKSRFPSIDTSDTTIEHAVVGHNVTTNKHSVVVETGAGVVVTSSEVSSGLVDFSTHQNDTTSHHTVEGLFTRCTFHGHTDVTSVGFSKEHQFPAVLMSVAGFSAFHEVHFHIESSIFAGVRRS